MSKHIILRSSLFWVKTQKSEDLIYTAKEAWKLAYSFYHLGGPDIGGSRFC
jgi:hypothetical protein